MRACIAVLLLCAVLVACGGTALPPTIDAAATATRALELGQIATLSAPTNTPIPVTATSVPPTATMPPTATRLPDLSPTEYATSASDIATPINDYMQTILQACKSTLTVMECVATYNTDAPLYRQQSVKLHAVNRRVPQGCSALVARYKDYLATTDSFMRDMGLAVQEQSRTKISIVWQQWVGPVVSGWDATTKEYREGSCK
jgi:hypothetical protein